MTTDDRRRPLSRLDGEHTPYLIIAIFILLSRQIVGGITRGAPKG